MNTLSRLDAYLGGGGLPRQPDTAKLLMSQPAPPLAPLPAAAAADAGPSSATSSALSKLPVPLRRLSSSSSAVVAADAAAPAAPPATPFPNSLASFGSASTAGGAGAASTSARGPLTPRRTRRRRRRVPTGASIKLPPPTTPLLMRVALALWSILLAFWRSLVGDTRAVRSLRHKQRGLRTCETAGAGVDAGAALPPLPSPASSASSADVIDADPDAVMASSDEGSGSEAEHDGWVDPVTRAPEEAGADPGSAGPADSEFEPRTGASDTTFSLRLRSGRSKEAVSITGVFDPPTPPTDHGGDGDIGPRRRRLLPNPMQTSLLDPSVPAVPQRSVVPTPAPALRVHQTPFHLQKTLILDLDETLIHSTSRPIGSFHAGGGMLGIGSGLFGRRGRREGHTVEVVLNGRSTTYHVYKRPFVDFFLKKVASWYTLVIYTASMPEYADPVIDWLDNGRGLFAKRLYRESCHLQANGSYIKDLSLVDKDLGRVCFMDNSPISYTWNKANALPIEGWTSDPNDEALLQSIPVLDSLRFVTDVRRILGIRGFS